MPLLARAGTIVRKPRRRGSGPRQSFRRGSAPTVLQQSRDKTLRLAIGDNERSYLTPLPIPTKSVSFTCVATGNSTYVDLLHENGPVVTKCDKDQCYYGSATNWHSNTESDRPNTIIRGLIEAHLESHGWCDFLHRTLSFFGTLRIVTFFFCLLMLLPLAMTAIGVNYLYECPKEPKLPIYLVVGGSFGMIKVMLTICKQMRDRRRDSPDDSSDNLDDDALYTMSRLTSTALSFFLVIWFALGNYWLFRVWKPLPIPDLHEPRNWCNDTVFMFAFWQMIGCHGLLSILLLIVGLITVWYACASTCRTTKALV